MLFDCVETVADLMKRASTQTGLQTTVNIIRRSYEAGRVATTQMKEALKVKYDQLLPKWNYVATP